MYDAVCNSVIVTVTRFEKRFQSCSDYNELLSWMLINMNDIRSFNKVHCTEFGVA